MRQVPPLSHELRKNQALFDELVLDPCETLLEISRRCCDPCFLKYLSSGLLLSQSVLSIILGGGAGTRLYPLTKKRAKPAVPLVRKHVFMILFSLLVCF